MSTQLPESSLHSLFKQMNERLSPLVEDERGGAEVVAVTRRVSSELDPCEVAFSSHAEGESWFCFDQPNRGFAVAAIGSVRSIEEGGAERFTRAAAGWEELVRTSVVIDIDSGESADPERLIAVGGFAFSAQETRSPQWAEFGAGRLTIPAVAIVRDGNEAWITVARSTSDRSEQAELERATPMQASVTPDFREAVAAAVHRIEQGEFEKIVLAREITLSQSCDFDVQAVFSTLRDKHPGCFICCVGMGASAFVAASPELLVRRSGETASTIALAGSIKRSADPATDEQLGQQLLASQKDRGEQAIVTRRIVRALEPMSSSVKAPAEPVLMKMANIQHLATPIEARLIKKTGVIELVGKLHPTPAVGAEPPAAVSEIYGLERIDRGWYAGPIGWVNGRQEGEFCVGLRSALIEGNQARLFAGVGVVKGSDPDSEFAETEAKFGALRPVLTAEN